MHDGGLHLGCTPWLFPLGGRAELIARQSSLAEELGYESFWLPETHFGADAIPEPLMLLAAAASVTGHIRLGTTSYLLPLRHPLQAAAQVAVLDQLSGGRVILGVGRGFAPELFEAYRLRRSEKRELFAECLAGMRAAWAGEPVGGGVRLTPSPVQKPHPPVWVAAFGPKALAQAGTLGLPYLASPLESLDTLADNYARHREACAAAGNAPPADVPILRTIFVSDDEDCLAQVRAQLERRMDEMHHRGGLVHGQAQSIEDWAIVGTPGEVRDAIERYRERLGITHLIATRLHLPEMEASVCESSLRALAGLAPQLR